MDPVTIGVLVTMGVIIAWCPLSKKFKDIKSKFKDKTEEKK